MSMASRAILSNFFEEQWTQNHPQPPAIPFGLVSWTFSDNLSRIWNSCITRYTRETESDKRISKPNVESELNCQNRDYLTLGIPLRVLMTIVWYYGEVTDRIFYWSPTWTKTSELEQSVGVRTDMKSESGIPEGSPAWTFLQVETPTLLLLLFSSQVLLAVITLFLQTLAFYHVNDVKIHTSEQQLKDLGSHF